MRLPKRGRTFRRRAATPLQTPHTDARTVTKPPVTPLQGLPTSTPTPTESPMKGGVVDPETEALPMEIPPPATQTMRGHATRLIERRLDELDACLAKALASQPRFSDVDGRLRRRTDFLRSLIAAERESHKGGALPGHFVDFEWRFGVLERTIAEWAQSGVAAPTEDGDEEEEPDEAAAGSASASGSGSGGCSCTGSCSGFEEVTGKEAAFDAKCNLNQENADAPKDKAAAAAAAAATGATAAEAAAAAIEVAPATRTTARRRWWKRLAALCGGAVVVAVVALGAGLALEFAAVSQQSVYVVPT